MAGLNDNFLLPDDSMEPKAAPAVTIKAFKEDSDEGGTPELRDDLDLIAVATENLSVQMRDLDLFKEHLALSGGINQNIALESHSLLPNLISDEHPIEFFTKHPSRTMLSAALEEVQDEKKGLLEKIKNFVVDMITRVVEWFKKLFTGDKAKELATKENTQLLAGIKTTISETAQASKEAENVATASLKDIGDKIEALKQKQEAQQQEAKEHAEKIQKIGQLQQYVNTIKATEFGPHALVGELNSQLAKMPIVRKILANINEINPVLFSHRNNTALVNRLIRDIKNCVDKNDYQGLQAIMDDGRFSQVAEEANKLAQVMVEFKALPTDYTVESMDKFLVLANASQFFTAYSYGESITVSGLAECTATSEQMDELLKSIHSMELYKWGKDDNAEAIAKKFLEELKTFNQQVIVPVTQRLAFSFTVVAQLVAFVKSLHNLTANLTAAVDADLKKHIIAKAKELGIPEQEAFHYL